MHTAWTSDRIPPKTKPQKAPQKTKGKGGNDAPAKSQEVRRLERLRDDLQKPSAGAEKDPKGGCFCQARMHALSSYTPLCRACGLVLCELNLSHNACPSCATPLLSAPARAALIEELAAQLAATLAREEDDRQRALKQARAAEGAFPTLAGSAGSSRAGTPDVHPANQTHKVLSLDAKTKRAKVTSYTPPNLSRKSSVETATKAPQQQEYKRVPAPPKEVVVPTGSPSIATRPRANTRGLNVTYVPPTRVG